MSWTSVAVLGAYHGLNPAMGWLFAVAIGFQQGRAAGVLRALPAIALGHVVSVGVALALIGAAALVIPTRVLQLGVAAALVAFAAYLRLRRRAHPRGAGMRMGFVELAFWSFLMASAHGAGLMLFPVIMRGTAPVPGHAHAAHALHAGSLHALALHSAAMFLAMTCAALVTFHVLGVGFLRRLWINLDALWIAALLLAALVTLLGM